MQNSIQQKPSISTTQHLKICIREATDRLNTAAKCQQPIFGTSYDHINYNIAWAIKRPNFLERLHNAHVLKYITREKEWTPLVFNQEDTLKKHCLTLISEKTETKKQEAFKPAITNYQHKSTNEIIAQYNDLNPL